MILVKLKEIVDLVSVVHVVFPTQGTHIILGAIASERSKL